jgi:c-di-GMP-binding flagellar brake protein YcgR
MLKDWLQKIHSKPEVDSELSNVYLTLHHAQHQHCFLEVAPDSGDEVYQSMILSLDPEERTILIDELFPTDFVGLPGQCVNISIRQTEGRKLQFSSVIVERHEHRGQPLYVLAMPQVIEADQRRSSYRLPMAYDVNIKSSFVGPDDQNYRARLRNLSAGGVCVELDGEVASDWWKDNKLTEFMFDFGGINVDCQLDIRNVSNTTGEVKGSVLGGEFSNLSAVTQRELERSIMKVQRDRARITGDLI